MDTALIPNRDEPHNPTDLDDRRFFKSVQGPHIYAHQKRDGDLVCSPWVDSENPHNHWYDWDAFSACFTTLGGGGGASPVTRAALAFLTYGDKYQNDEAKERVEEWKRLAQGRDITVTRRPENNPSFFRVRATDALVTIEFMPQTKYASGGKEGLKHGVAHESQGVKLEFTAESVGDAAKFQALRLIPIAMLLDYGRRPKPSTVTVVYPPYIDWNSCVHDRGNYKAGRQGLYDTPYTI